MIEKELEDQKIKFRSLNDQLIEKLKKIYIAPEHILSIAECMFPRVLLPNHHNNTYAGQIIKIGAGCRDELMGNIAIFPELFSVTFYEDDEENFVRIKANICNIKYIMSLMEPIEIK